MKGSSKRPFQGRLRPSGINWCFPNLFKLHIFISQTLSSQLTFYHDPLSWAANIGRPTKTPAKKACDKTIWVNQFIQQLQGWDFGLFNTLTTIGQHIAQKKTTSRSTANRLTTFCQRNQTIFCPKIDNNSRIFWPYVFTKNCRHFWYFPKWKLPEFCIECLQNSGD